MVTYIRHVERDSRRAGVGTGRTESIEAATPLGEDIETWVQLDRLALVLVHSLHLVRCRDDATMSSADNERWQLLLDLDEARYSLRALILVWLRRARFQPVEGQLRM